MIMKNKEIERKFLVYVNQIPYDLNTYEYTDITQGYLPEVSNFAVRIREELKKDCRNVPIGENWVQTIKSKGTKVRDEFEINLLKDQYDKLWILFGNCTIQKRRYQIKNDGATFYLDCFKNDLEGLWTVEVEFVSEKFCDDFTPPIWFGEEITYNTNYTNLSMALNGYPTYY